MTVNFKLEDFIPLYGFNPSINQSYNEDDERSFYESIVRKKEFDELRLSTVEQLKKGKLFKHQSFISRFISSYTPYDKILLYHAVGTGKACIVSAVVEAEMKHSSNFRGAIVMTRNPTLKNDLIQKIATSCTGDKYVPKEQIYSDSDSDEEKTSKRSPRKKRSLDDKDILKQIRKNVKQNYSVFTFSAFSKEIKMMTDMMLKKEYNNRIIIIDEAHNVKLRDEEGVNTYSIIHHFLHTIQGCKILLMTATPMKDSPSEIVDILNLILPLDKQLNKIEFNETYITPKGFNTSLSSSFKNTYLRGMISYVRAMSENINVIYEGIIDRSGGMKYTKLVELEMDNFQSQIYKKAYQDEKGTNENESEQEIEQDSTKENTLWLKSRQAGMFVYPDKTFGAKGEEKHLIEKSKKFYLSDTVKNFIEKNGKDNMSKLKQLRVLSVKFYAIIKEIIENPNEKVFVYSNIVKGGGAQLFSAVLQLFDFSAIDIPTRTDSFSLSRINPANRFILITGGLLTPAQTDLVIGNVFNAKENLHGEYARVIIGSHVVGEGLSFKHVKRMYVLTPFWNTPTIDQAVGRVIRADSHTDFENPEERFVRINFLTAIPNNPDQKDNFQESIDFMMYKISEDKDIKIKSVERLLKESAIDCSINYKRNVSVKDKPNTKQCDYTKNCNYTCDYIDSKYSQEDWVGTRVMDTYNLYYAEDDIQRVKTSIRNAFRKKNAYDFYEFYNLIRNEIEDISFIVISRSLNEMILNNDMIKNRLGFPNYLREDRNLYFLTDDPLSSTLYTSYYYSLHPRPETNFSTFNDILTYQQLISIDTVIPLLIEKQNDKVELDQLLNNLPMHIIQKLIQVFLFARLKQSIENIELQNYIIKKYENFIIEYDDFFILKMSPTNVSKLNKYPIEYDWVMMNEEDMTRLQEESKSQVEILRQDPIGYYGIVDTKHTGELSYKNLKIVKVRELVYTQKGEVSKAVSRMMDGQTCSEGNYQLSGLIILVYELIQKSKQYGKIPLKIPITKEYTAEKIVKMEKFNKYLEEYILQEIRYRPLINKLLQYTPDMIKKIFGKVLEKKNNKVRSVVEARTEFTEQSIKNIFEMLQANIIDKLFKEAEVEDDEISVKDIVKEIEKLGEDGINQIGNVLLLKATILCPILQQWFKENKLSLTK